MQTTLLITLKTQALICQKNLKYPSVDLPATIHLLKNGIPFSKITNMRLEICIVFQLVISFSNKIKMSLGGWRLKSQPSFTKTEHRSIRYGNKNYFFENLEIEKLTPQMSCVEVSEVEMTLIQGRKFLSLILCIKIHVLGSLYKYLYQLMQFVLNFERILQTKRRRNGDIYFLNYLIFGLK